MCLQALRRFAKLGSDAMYDPSELFSQCVAVNLLPQPAHDSLTGSMESSDIEVYANTSLVSP